MIAARYATSPLTADIEALVAGVQGWTPVDELFALSMLAYATVDVPGDLLELGSWCGRSAIVLGAAARETHGVVHCIDLFPSRQDWQRHADGTYLFQVELDGEPHIGNGEVRVWAEPFAAQIAPVYDDGDLLEQFTRNIRTRGLDTVVRAHKGTAATFAAAAPAGLRCRLIFIDGDHGYDAVVRDIASLEPFLLPGGWLVFDDAFASYAGVNQAIGERILGNPGYDITRQLTRKCFAARRATSGRQP